MVCSRAGLPIRVQLFAAVALTAKPTPAIAIAPMTAPVIASITAASTGLGSFVLPLPVTTVSTIDWSK